MGHSATTDYFQRATRAAAIDEFRQALEIFREVGDRTMEAWALHMLGTGLLRNGDPTRRARHVEHAIRHFHAAGDAAGRDADPRRPVGRRGGEGDLPRAARLRGAARNLTAETGTGLAGYVEDAFEAGIRPGVRAHMSEADLARYGAEGAAMTARRGGRLCARGAVGEAVEDGPQRGPRGDADPLSRSRRAARAHPSAGSSARRRSDSARLAFR